LIWRDDLSVVHDWRVQLAGPLLQAFHGTNANFEFTSPSAEMFANWIFSFLTTKANMNSPIYKRNAYRRHIAHQKAFSSG
jgi:hypothetical protein